MDYKKKLKSRFKIAVIYIVLGLVMIASTFLTETENDFISSFGFTIVIIGIVRIRNYRMITKDEEAIKKQQIIETDERTVSIIHKAKGTAFSVYSMVLSVAIIILSFLSLHEIAKWIAYSVILLVAIYWICYLVYQKKS